MSRANTPARLCARPGCGRPVAPEHRPFCGQGCRDRDLLDWLGEGHRIPGPPADEDGHEIDVDGLDSRRGPPL